MSFGFGFGFTKITAAIRAAFSPSSLFAAGEPGVWFDPSDLSTLYQDAAGTVPVTGVERPVGLMLDKSKGLGPELVTNGDFSNGTTGWALGAGWNISGGAAEHVVSNTGSILQTVPAVAGRFYEVSFDVMSIGGVSPSISARIGSGSSLVTITGTGRKRFIQTPTGSTLGSLQISASNNTSVVVDNISVRELPGNHAFQTTTTSRPVLSARVNLLTKTEDISSADWATYQIASRTATKFVPSAAYSEHYIGNSISKLAGSIQYTARFDVKDEGYGFAPVVIGDLNGPAAANGWYFCINLSDGSYTTPATFGTGWATGTVSITRDSATGICTVTIVFTTSTESTRVGLSVYAYPSLKANSPFNFIGNGTSGIYLSKADLRPTNTGVNLPPYQRVNTATDYDTAGFPHYLRFDGVDDWLVTNTITPGIDKVQVFAGVRKLSDAAIAIVVESSADWFMSNGAFALAAPNTVAANFGWNSRGSLSVMGTTANSFPVPTTQVLSGVSSISEDILRLRQNGVQTLNVTTNQGTGNFLAYPLYIGRRAGTTLPFNGHIYGLIVRFGSNLLAATIENTEKYINTKTRAF